MKRDEAKVGVVVRLNSGGPDMTVEGVLDDGRVLVTWFTAEGQRGGATLGVELLTVVKPAK